MRPKQEDQIRRQIEAYERQRETRTVQIPLGTESFQLEIDPFVANPEIMNSGIQVVRFFVERPRMVRGKIATDMGTGSGIIGIAIAKLGAESVFMPEKDPKAVANASRNVASLGLGQTCEPFESDLFANYGDRPPSDVQIFNHPFFSSPPLAGKEWTQMMLGGEDLIGRYLEEAPRCSKPETQYVLPWFTLAENIGGLDNDPGKRARDFGYRVVDVVEQAPTEQGIQQGAFKIYTLEKITS